MNIKAIIYYILTAIDEASQINSLGRPIRISIDDELYEFLNEIGRVTLINLFEKLENEKVIKLLQWPENPDLILEPEGTPEYYFKICYYFKKLENFNMYFNEVEKELIEKEKDSPKIVNNNLELKCGDLVLNLTKATLQYKDNKPIEIEPENREIKFLKLLMESKGEVIKYWEIAKMLNLKCIEQGVTEIDIEVFSREVQFLKRDLNKFLIKAGFEQEKLDKMVVAKKNMGYKLNC